ncbi:hypothetical protein SerAS12_2722 [Serratia sp. AS12]|uniref:KTSC domain-containing protein n=1 Tax=Serratia TaxID=613 RepID=UPI00020EA0CA|nr:MULTISPECIES: KTSC domain-containing protein [Serratia]AEF45842.1 hypothetical protein SerAS9_2721 [Serratia plymuthica AS9]AEF50793.1 hypothetical protein SerAS12_2722 [Serratia sp. AS12]AEG28500.1 hypothetical protein SerAS13_2723 [Serratia sp. AS13]MBJ7891017.1 KTSC domain-containing protein [Serratia sp. PAMC26656]UTN94599.1 KTSC domain-containing protein [Serratia plymuthica]
MQRQPVSSSRIISIGYDENAQVLEIQFRDAGIYQYIGVPNRIYQDFVAVVSKGRFYDGVIKGKYLCRKTG